ncbi:MAG: transcriptional repressor [Candidatus Coatesbacteria bacterium]|nr:transcriptional repressor [Candidatus Coatesbacteria bacterium]
MTEDTDVRMTSQRCAILDAVKGVKSHPTADEVYEIVRQKLPSVSLGTVYRNLDTLSATGAIRRLGLEDGKMRFDGDTSTHYHVRCSVCGRVDDVEVVSFKPPRARVEGESGYRITGCNIEFMGTCPSCLREAQDGCQKPRDAHEGEEKCLATRGLPD